MDAQSYMARVQKAVQQYSQKKYVFTDLGYSYDDYYDFKHGMNRWLDEPTHQMFRAAQALLKGNLYTKFTKMLAIEREITRKVIGKKQVTLYRGIDGKYCKRVYNIIKQRKYVTIPLRGASSWSSDEGNAGDFGPIVIEHTFPIDWIISCHLSNGHVNGYGEDEYIVAVPDKKIRVHRDNVYINEEIYDARSRWW